MHAADGAASGLTTAQIAWRWSPLFFTHINQALLTTLPFAVAVYMVRDFEAARGGATSEAAVGRATGMLAAVFCAAQLVTQLPWGLVSDRIGRKPVLVVGNVACVVSVLLFGLSNSYGQAMAARAVGGALNAVILVEKAMIGEGLPTKDAQAKAFGLLSLCWGLGSLAGPLVGGALSAPCGGALRLEALCGGGALLAARPYFLPCLLAALLSGVATLMTVVGLEETLPSRRRAAAGGGGDSGGGGKYAALPSGDGAEGGSPVQPSQREVELGGMAGRDDSGFGSGGGQTPGKAGGSESQLHDGKPAPFRGDSARSPSWDGSPQLRAVRPPPLQPGDGGGRLASSGSQASRADLEVVVLEPEDIERGAFQSDAQQQQQQQQQLEQRGEQLEGEEDRLLPGGSAPAAEPRPAAADGGVVPPWYRQRTVVRSLFGYGLIAFMYNMLDEVVPIFASAAVAEGGLGFAPSQLAPSLSFGGFVLVLWALKGFPWLMRKLGVVRALRLGLWQTAPVALLPPCASLFHGALGPSQALMFVAMGLKAITATNAFTACLILVNAAAPRHALGAVNGAGQSLASLVRALGPALGGLSWGLSSSLSAQRWWPAWLPHQFVPFAGATAVALLTDAVYWGLRLPEEGPAPAR